MSDSEHRSEIKEWKVVERVWRVGFKQERLRSEADSLWG